MKTSSTPALLLGMIYASSLSYLIISAVQLPGRVATHFDAVGRPDGWMGRSSYLVLTAAMGFALPSLFVWMFFAIRFMPEGLQIPNRDRWLSPERRGETFDYLLRQSLWLACMALCFLTGLHVIVVRANVQGNTERSTPRILILGGCLLAGTAVWAASMFRHFSASEPEARARP